MTKPPWIDDEPTSAPRDPRRRSWLLAAAVAPWFLVLGVLVASGADDRGSRTATDLSAGDAQGDGDGGLTPPGSTTAAGDAVGPPPSTVSGETGAGGGDHAPPTHRPDLVPDTNIEVRHVPRGQPTLRDAGSLAEVVAHVWFADHEVLHVVTEAVEDASRDTLAATVLVIMRGSDGPEVHRLVVPLASTPGGTAPTGTPYVLPSAQIRPVAGDLEPLDDPALTGMAHEALRAAGYHDVTIGEVSTAPGWPYAVDVFGPDDGPLGPVWLTDVDGELTVVGSRRRVTDGDPAPHADAAGEVSP